MGRQKKIAAKIIERGGKYLLALKANHEKPHGSVMQVFETGLAEDLRPKDHSPEPAPDKTG